MPTTALPPGPRMPVALQGLAWLTRPVPFLERAHRAHGDVFTVEISPTEGKWVMLADPALIKEVFGGDPEALQAGKGNEVLRPILGPSSVLLLDGADHLRQRRLLLPPFHGERLARLRAEMEELAAAEVARWPRGTAFPLAPRMQELTLELILRVVFGVSGQALSDLRSALRDLLELVADPLTFLTVLVLGGRATRLPAARRALGRVDELIVREVRARRAAGDLGERADVLSMLVEARHEDGSAMGEDELRDELVTLLVAGHETTATALSWAMERLARHPDAWQRLVAEAREGGARTWTNAVVTETLRLRPVLPIVLRHLAVPQRIGSWDLPAGIKVAPCIALVHRRPDLYPEPLAFRPERWLEQRPQASTWLPFGGGVRRCLGAAFALQEMEVVLRAIALGAPDVRPGGDGRAEVVKRRAITFAPSRGGEVLVA